MAGSSPVVANSEPNFRKGSKSAIRLLDRRMTAPGASRKCRPPRATAAYGSKADAGKLSKPTFISPRPFNPMRPAASPERIPENSLKSRLRRKAPGLMGVQKGSQKSSQYRLVFLFWAIAEITIQISIGLTLERSRRTPPETKNAPGSRPNGRVSVFGRGQVVIGSDLALNGHKSTF